MEKNKSKLETKFELIKQLEKGEKSGFIRNFDRKAFLKKLHKKYLIK
ncbi:type II toxin-antitoxin system ParD family antitoxin [Chryseobacterium wanjuense]